MRIFAVVGLILVAGLFGIGGLSDMASADGDVYRENLDTMAIGVGVTAALSAIGLWSFGRRKDGE